MVLLKKQMFDSLFFLFFGCQLQPQPHGGSRIYLTSPQWLLNLHGHRHSGHGYVQWPRPSQTNKGWGYPRRDQHVAGPFFCCFFIFYFFLFLLYFENAYQFIFQKHFSISKMSFLCESHRHYFFQNVASIESSFQFFTFSKPKIENTLR